MPIYKVHTMDSAPELSRTGLEKLQKAFGGLPNIAGAVANSPKALNSLVGLFDQVHTSTLTEAEIQIILLTDAVQNSSTYAVAFHTALAQQSGVSATETEAIRSGGLPSDPRYRALSATAAGLINQRGHLSEQEVQLFLSAGFTQEELLVVIATVAASTITNYVATIAELPPDDFARAHVWQPS